MPENQITNPYHEIFLQEFEKLNPAQSEAVIQTEGPVLVIAGPGTGKTHILASRIGRILMESDTQPHNILCLTFTDAGVQAMRKRLLKLIGPEAHRVHIFTFHSFCNSVIQSHPERFGIRDLEPVSDLEQVEIIRRIIDELPHDHVLKSVKGDVYFFEGHLKGLFQQMKKENWSTSSVHEKIRAYLESLPDREAFIYKRNTREHKKGDLKTEKIEEEQIRMSKLWEASALLPRYTQLMQDLRRYDYDDMILWVLDAFKKHPSLLQRYQEQYLYFLVDEYQDTNGAQNEILHQLIEYWDNPNIFIVGDDDQSIYEFQGARLKNLVEFFHRYRNDLSLVVLDRNYRSTQQILDASADLIGKNQIRIINHLAGLGLEKVLTAYNPALTDSRIRPLIVEYPDRLQEEADLANQIEKLAKDGFPLDEIAVIYAMHRQAERLTELLQKKGIPYRTRRATNILDLPVIANLRLLIEYLTSEFHRPYSAEHLLFRIMHFDFLGFKPHDLATFAMGVSREESNRSAGLKWRDCLGDASVLSRLGIKDTGPFQELYGLIEHLLGEFANLTAPLWTERLINRSGLLRHLIRRSPATESGHPYSAPDLEALFTFQRFLKSESARDPRLSQGRLLELLGSMDDNRIPLPLYSSSPGGINGFEPVSGAVNLLTAHASKGLEFQWVFMFDCIRNNWESARRGGNYQFTLPDTLVLSGEEDAEEARRRLFYVAMTRAREHLQISYAARDDKDRELPRTRFIDEILMPDKKGEMISTPPVFTLKSVDPGELLHIQGILLAEQKPRIQAFEREAIRQVLDQFTLSVSSLNKYLYCPLSFYYENILKVPVLASDSARFGIAIHDALCLGFQSMLLSKEAAFPATGEFVRLFEKEMKRSQAWFSKKEYDRRLALGRTYIADYVEKNKHGWTRNVQVELDIKNIEIEGIPVTGKIDRVDILNGTSVHIVDYKTGSHDNRKLRKPDEANPHGGSYWRQLVFYKLLYEKWQMKPGIVTGAEISYLEPDKSGQYPSQSILFDPEDGNFVKGLIAETYNKIMDQDFYTGCGEPGCSWCQFLKQNIQVDTFAAAYNEELDDD